MINNVVTRGSIDPLTLSRIQRLLSTPQGSVAFDREYGVDLKALDNVPSAAEGQLMVEYCRKMLRYFPQYKIADISFAVDCNTITPTVVIAYA